MTRDASIPLFLWICAALCIHFSMGAGGAVVAKIHEDNSLISELAEETRERVRASEQTFEVAAIDVASAPPPQPDDVAPPPPPPPPKPAPTAKKDQPPPVTKPEPPKKDEPKKIVVVEKKDTPPPPPMQKLDDKRIAVRQHAKPNQADNPTAKFIADQANHVDSETAATQTSHDQDDPNPTPGGSHAGPQDRVGDSDRTKIAESEDKAGNKERSPGDRGTEIEVQKDPPVKPMGPVAIAGPTSPVTPQSGGDGRPTTPSNAPTPPQVAPGGPTAQATPDVQEATGGWSFQALRQPGGGGGAEGPGKMAQRAPQSPSSTKWMGLGGDPGPGQVNLNLNHAGAVAVVGIEELRREREADGERRRSEHRGAWQASNFERWRHAIENYVSTVKPGNQTALNTAAVPFASYLNGMHNQIHKFFADSFLDSLDGLPKDHPLNDQKLVTHLEIVLSKDGHVVKMGVVKASGQTPFDMAALDSVQRASPFGPAPAAIVSSDGRVYLHWEFHRDHTFACSTMNARPYILNLPPAGAPDPAAPPGRPSAPSPTRERGAPPPVNVNETREGALPPKAGNPLTARAPLPRGAVAAAM